MSLWLFFSVIKHLKYPMEERGPGQVIKVGCRRLLCRDCDQNSPCYCGFTPDTRRANEASLLSIRADLCYSVTISQPAVPSAAQLRGSKSSWPDLVDKTRDVFFARVCKFFLVWRSFSKVHRRSYWLNETCYVQVLSKTCRWNDSWRMKVQWRPEHRLALWPRPR